jgi:hypothetical protein
VVLFSTYKKNAKDEIEDLTGGLRRGQMPFARDERLKLEDYPGVERGDELNGPGRTCTGKGASRTAGTPPSK